MLQCAGGIHLQGGPQIRAAVSLCWWLRISGSCLLPFVGSPCRRYRGKLGILGSGPRSSPSLAHWTVLPGALTPHHSSAAAPSTTVKFSGRAQKPRGAEAGTGTWARPGDTEVSVGEGGGSAWRMWVENKGHLALVTGQDPTHLSSAAPRGAAVSRWGASEPAQVLCLWLPQGPLPASCVCLCLSLGFPCLRLLLFSLFLFFFFCFSVFLSSQESVSPPPHCLSLSLFLP